MSKDKQNQKISYQNLMDTMALGVVYQDANGKIIFANPAAEGVLGLTLDQMTGRTSMDPRWKAVQEDGSDFSGESHPAMVALKTGKSVEDVIMGVFNPELDAYRWLNVNAVPEFKSGEPKPFQVYTIFEDMTERRNAEALIVQERDFISKVLAWIDSLVVVIDLKGYIAIFNRASELLSGYQFNEVQDKPFWDILLMPEEHEAVKQTIKDVIHKGIAKNSQNFWLTKSGQKRMISWKNSVLTKADGTIEYILCTGLDITEAHKIERALRESEAKYRELVQNANSIILRLDTRGRITFFNEYAQTFFGYRENEILGKNAIGTIIPGVDTFGKKLTSLIDDIASNPNQYATYENENKLRNGERVWVAWTNKAIYDQKGSVVEILAIGNDITERKRAEEAIRESEGKFRNIVNASPMGIHLYELHEDKKLELVGANLASDQILGISQKNFLGKTIEDAFPGLRDTEVPERYREAAEFGKMWRTEQINYDEGEIKGAFEVVAFQIEPGKMAALFNEITSRKIAEAALQESEERFRTLVEESPVGISLIGPHGRYLYTNAMFEKTFGYKQSDISTGKEWFRKAFPDKAYRDAVVRTWVEDKQSAMDLRSRPRVYTVTCNDGSDKEIYFRPVTLENRNELVIYEDITERKRAEAALRETEEKLIRSKKMESLGLLAGGIAHDLNNVLSGIVSYPELILMDLPEDSKLRTPIEAIQESGHRAAAIVQDLLTVARGVATPKEPLNINEHIMQYLASPEYKKLKQFQPDVIVRTDLDTELLNIGGSPVHISKVLMNLVSNAIEAIEGDGDVVISTRNRYLDRPLKGYDEVTIGEYVVLSITDTGSGISAQDLERIFEPFYSKKFLGRSGTGLGLAVVWNTVQDHSGYIDVRSVAQGTTFELYLPITREEIHPINMTIPFEDLQGQGEKVLVVDDVASQRDISSKMLTTLGYSCEAFPSGEEAIQYLKENKADLIVLDMIMDPGINGRETYERVVKLHPSQKAIIVSGYAETEEVTKAQKLGAGKYIKKPLTLEKIGVAVKEELMKSRT